MLQRDVQEMLIDLIELESEGICIRFCPLENAHGTTKSLLFVLAIRLNCAACTLHFSQEFLIVRYLLKFIN